MLSGCKAVGLVRDLGLSPEHAHVMQLLDQDMHTKIVPQHVANCMHLDCMVTNAISRYGSILVWHHLLGWQQVTSQHHGMHS